MPEMTGNHNNNKWAGPALIAGVVGVTIWKSISPDTRENIWRFLEGIAMVLSELSAAVEKRST